ncbi:MAG: adenosylcobalamin-dependent ribonucleoside-diphosphate reductase [Gammaproteobacteria bacterium]|nr:adenosylcobalamin-dependent ribonucleoside-diphosphate reductase [Gammaproteobacteria bacterium]
MTTAVPPGWPAISRHVWESRYRQPGEADLDATWSRVAAAVASAEQSDREGWTARFRELLAGFRFLPGGRILAGAGTGRRVTLCNCFVMGVIEDRLPAIFDSLAQGALTMQQGGGIGYDFSTLRPQGTQAQASGAIASGPVSFMRIWDVMCSTVLSTGARRGAMMATLRCDHPDIEAFIDAKRDPAELRHFNLSVQVTDDFLAAVHRREDWPLVFPAAGNGEAGPIIERRWTGASGAVPCRVERIVPAAALWERLVNAAYDTAEPGVLFVDAINRDNNLHWREQLTATNPCGEIPLPPFGACDLGSLNLTAFVIDPFEPGARLDLERLRSSTRTAVRLLDNVLDITAFPLAEQSAVARATRRIGLGITGLGDALAMLGQRYDSWTGRGVAEEVMRTVCLEAYAASVDLACERGSFPAFERDAFLAGGFLRRLPSALREAIARDGIRNSHLLAIAPAGTISLLAGNLSSGIEPIYALEARRQVLDASGRYETHRTADFAWSQWQQQFPGAAPPATLVEAARIEPLAHLAMQAALQPWVDNAISKTINVAADIGRDAFGEIYLAAHRLGLKGCTVFRPNAIRGQILAPQDMASASPCCGIEREGD